MKIRIYYLATFLIIIFTIYSCNNNSEKNQRDTYEMDHFINDLMAKMTLEEKIGQLNLVSIGFDVTGPTFSAGVEENIKNGLVGAVLNNYTPVAVGKLQKMAVEETRLGIPLMFGYDVIHGLKTIFPIPLGMAASWDLEAIEKCARIATEEATAAGINWIFSPMVDIARDPRWGRISEGYGEDPWYGSQVAKTMIKGIQGNDLSKNNTAMACVKHFALYGAAEAGRDYNTVDMSKIRMYQDYLPPYKAAIDAGVGSVMSSFNEINGIPATGNKWLMTELLRNEWGFNGFVVTDHSAILEMVEHGVGNEYEVGVLALKAGVDMDMVVEVYLNNLKKAVENGDVKETDIDKACRRILEAKYKLGLFEDPYKYVNAQKAKNIMMQDSFIDASRDMARKSMVLLKNENQVLPLKKSGNIALIGPLADNQRNLIGNWSAAGDWNKAVSLAQGIRNVVGDKVKINYAKGSNIIDDEQLIKRLNQHRGNLDIDPRSAEEMINEAVKIAKQSDVIIAAVGEPFGMSGEASSRTNLKLPGRQLDLLKALKKTGKPLVVVLMNGRPLTIKWEAENADAILETWFAGLQAGNAIADVLFGNYNPSGKITATFPQVVGQIPIYYSHKNTGRPFDGDIYDKYKTRYLDVSNDPLFPFGYGLSYTSFDYSELQLSDTLLKAGDILRVSVEVKNTGDYNGEEVVQLYIRDLVGSVTRPVKELKNFKKVFIKKDEIVKVTFDVTVDDLKFYNKNLKYDWEPGEFVIMVGRNSSDVKSVNVHWVK